MTDREHDSGACPGCEICELAIELIDERVRNAERGRLLEAELAAHRYLAQVVRGANFPSDYRFRHIHDALDALAAADPIQVADILSGDLIRDATETPR